MRLGVAASALAEQDQTTRHMNNHFLQFTSVFVENRDPSLKLFGASISEEKTWLTKVQQLPACECGAFLQLQQRMAWTGFLLFSSLFGSFSCWLYVAAVDGVTAIIGLSHATTPQLFAGGGDYEAYSDAPQVQGTFPNTTAGRQAEAQARASLISRAASPDTELALQYP